MTVTPVNDAPVAVNDLAATPEDTATTVNVLANDSDLDGDTLTVTGATVPAAQGTVAVNPDGTLLYTPATNFNGTATITYTISDGNGGSATATVTVTVTAVNDAPVAVDDATTTPEDTAKTVNVLGNDSDPENDPLTVTVATVPAAQGTVSINADGTLLYTPAANFNGTATISYTISDGQGGNASAQAIVTVTPVNDAPVAVNNLGSTTENVAVTINVLGNDSDVDGDTLTVTAATVPAAQGTVAINPDGTLLFTPATSFNGTATISYTISDGQGGTATAQAIVQIGAQNDAPVAVDDAATTPEDVSRTITVLGNDSDIDGDTLTVTSATVPAAQGSVIVNADGTLLYTPAPDFNGLAMISYSIADGNGGTALAQVAVTVSPANDAPGAADDIASTPEETAATIAVLANDSDVDGDTLTVTTATVDPAQGTVTINADQTLLFTPAANFNGTATISYTITDGQETAAAQVVVTVGGVNDAPVAVDDLASTTGETPIEIDVLANDTDPEGDALTLESVTLRSGRGTVSITAAGELAFTAATGFHGVAIVEYVVRDAGGAEAAAFCFITVNGPPVALPDSANVLKSSLANTLAVLGNDGDPDAGDTITIVKAQLDPLLGTAAPSADRQSIVFTPQPGVTGSVQFSYSITDGRGGFAESTVTVTITETPANRAPVAVTDKTTTTPGVAVDTAVLTNDTDPENDPLTLTAAVGNAAQGTATVVGQNVSFQPAAGFEGSATIRYTITDGQGNAAEGTLIVEVLSPNLPPIARDDVAKAASGTPSIFTVLSNDLDPEGGVLQLTGVTPVNPAAGTAVANPDGTITFTPAAGFTGVADLVYTITDPAGATAQATLSVTVSATLTNTAPVTKNDTATTQPGQPVTVLPLTNDTDPEGDVLTVTGVTVDPAQGTVTVDPAGKLIFTPAPGFTGIVTITYTVIDPSGAEGTGTITVLVNNLPVAGPDLVDTKAGQPVTVNVMPNDSDPDGHVISVIGFTTDPSVGTLVFNGTSSFTFTPAASFSGRAVLTYTLQDELGGQAEGQIVITVNDPPVVTDDQAETEIGTPITLNVLGSATDPNGDPLRVIGATVDLAQGTVLIQPDGTLLFTPAPTFTGPANITYLVADRWNAVSSATFTIGRRNALPTTQDRLVYCFCNVPLQINALRGASDPDNDALTVVSVSKPKFGRVVIMANGYVKYVAGLSFNNPTTTDSFTVTVRDARGGLSTMVVRVASFNSLNGTYQGLVSSSAPSAAAAPIDGRLTVTLNNAASFSGVLQLGTTRLPFTGRLESRLDYLKKLKVAGYPNAKLHVAYLVETKTFAAEVTGLDHPMQAPDGLRVVSKRHAVSGLAYAGNYRADVLLRGADPSMPAGDLTVKVNASGMATLRGFLPDGRAFVTSAGVFASGAMPIYTPYKATAALPGGHVAGVPFLNPTTPPQQLTGSLEQDFGASEQLDLAPSSH